MGLLDDAIREHLESRRLNGADPSEVAREEREALGPVRQGEDATSLEQAAASEDHDEELDDERGDPAEVEDHSSLGQATAELDMRTVLEEDSVEHGLHDAESL
jgi:hypothetical protein